jgi:hypothetical protein
MIFGVNPGAGHRVNRWLSVGAGFSVLYVNLDQKAAVNNSAVPGQAGQSDGNPVSETTMWDTASI